MFERLMFFKFHQSKFWIVFKGYKKISLNKVKRQAYSVTFVKKFKKSADKRDKLRDMDTLFD